MFPRVHWSRSAVLVLCLGLALSGGRRTEAAPAFPAQTVNPTPGGTTTAPVSAESTSFDEVAARLDRGGSFYLYLSTAQWLAGLSQEINQWRDLVVSSDTDGSDADREKIAQAFTLGSALVKKSGLEQITGVGASSFALEPGIYRNTFFVHHYAGKETGFFNTLFGGAPHPLTALDLLPADTALASFGDYDLTRFVGEVRATLEQSGSPDVKKSVADGLSQFATLTGLSLDEFLQSLGGSGGIIFTLDPVKKIDVPLGPGQKQAVPLPRLAVLAEVKDDRIFQRIEQVLGTLPSLIKIDEPGLRMRTMTFPAMPNFVIRATVARWDKFLVLASDDQLVRDIIAAQTTGQGFKASAAFAKLSAGLPTEGNGMGLVTQTFADTLRQSQTAMLENQSGSSPAQVAMMRKVFAVQAMSASYAVSAHVENGWLTVSKGAQNVDKVLLPLIVAPIAIFAGAAMPVVNTVQEKSKATTSLAQAKQIGLACKLYAGDNDGRFPPSLAALLPTYMTDKSLFVSPFAPDEPMGYDYKSGLTESAPPDTILLEDKFSAKDRQRIVVHVDCSGTVTRIPRK